MIGSESKHDLHIFRLLMQDVYIGLTAYDSENERVNRNRCRTSWSFCDRHQVIPPVSIQLFKHEICETFVSECLTVHT